MSVEMEPAAAARLLGLLVRSNASTLPLFAARSGAARSLDLDSLRELQLLLLAVAGWLVNDDPVALRSLLKRAGALTEPQAAEPSPPSNRETGAVDLATVDRVREQGATPFNADQAATPPPMATAAAHPSAGRTAAVDLGALEAGAAVYPLSPRQPMSAERYAMLIARSEHVDAARRAAVHAELGVADEAHRTRIEREMTAAMGASHALRAEVDHHLERWRRWLREQEGR